MATLACKGREEEEGRELVSIGGMAHCELWGVVGAWVWLRTLTCCEGAPPDVIVDAPAKGAVGEEGTDARGDGDGGLGVG